MARKNVVRLFARTIAACAMMWSAASEAATSSPSTAYGQNGVATLPAISYGYYEDVVLAYQTRADGVSYVLRVAVDSQSNESYGVYRLTAAGAVDSSFATNGVHITNTTGQYLRYQGLLLDEARNRFYLIGRDNVGPCIDAYLLDGTKDSRFGVNGHLSIESSDEAAAEYGAFDSNGRILLGMHYNSVPETTTNTVELARLSPSGVLDNTFGNGGVSKIQFADGGDYAATYMPLELRPSGTIVVPIAKAHCTQSGGACTGNSYVGAAVARFPSTGFSTTQSDSNMVQLVASGHIEPFATVLSGNDTFNMLLSNYDDTTFKTYAVSAVGATTLIESVAAPTFKFVDGQNIGVFNDGSLLIGGYGTNGNSSTVPVEKLVGSAQLAPYIAPATTNSEGGGGAFSVVMLVVLALSRGGRAAKKRIATRRERSIAN